MSGRTYECIGILHLAAQYCLECCRRSTCCQRGNFEALMAEGTRSVAGITTARLGALSFDSGKVLGGVNAKDVFIGRWCRGDPDQVTGQA